MPKQINTYSYGQALVRLFALKGRFQPVLDETIVPVIDVGRDPVRRIAWSGDAIGPVVGEFGYAQLKNQGGTSKNIVLTDVNLVLATQGFLEAEMPSTGPALGDNTVIPAQWRDARLPGDPAQGSPGSTITSHGRSTAALTNKGSKWLVGNLQSTGVWLKPNLIIPPGSRVMFQCVTANIQLNWAFMWYEEDITAGTT